MENVVQETKKAISDAIKIDEKGLLDHLDGLVRQSVEETLNSLLNAEADAICQAGPLVNPSADRGRLVKAKKIRQEKAVQIDSERLALRRSSSYGGHPSPRFAPFCSAKKNYGRQTLTACHP